METIIENIKHLLKNNLHLTPTHLEKLPQSGSDRIYFRVFTPQQSFIATYNTHVTENKTFIYFAQHFYNLGLAVPKVLAVQQDDTLYIQEDVGTDNLLEIIEKEGHTPTVFTLFKKSLQQLAKLQIQGNNNLDYNYCITAKEFGKEAILSDLLYFKYYFLDTLKLPYDKQALLKDFDALSTYLSFTEHKYFMFRDFQSRNIMVNNNEVFFIDFQGGMKGALQYDVASLLWQAKAQLSEEWKNQLLAYYIDCVELELGKSIDKPTFISQYNGFVLIRLLQVMGAYGFRGLFERKAHFLASIPYGLRNLQYFVQNKKTGIALPEFEKILQQITHPTTIQQFTPVTANEHTALVITINSFSYKKGIPTDNTANGGGFVFDMRGILNPGRFDEYKYLSGLDKPVQDFLEQRTQMPQFLNSIWDTIDITVENYLHRNFENLMINFGCTGGQHRSVFAAEQTARHLRNKYKVKVILQHTNKANWLTHATTSH
jgi:aminoglycoside/choline kinase family phosphotransferase